MLEGGPPAHNARDGTVGITGNQRQRRVRRTRSDMPRQTCDGFRPPWADCAMPWVCYRRRNQWLRLALALFCLPLMWLARVVYLLVGVAEGWGGRRGYAYPCAVLGHAMLRYTIP